MDIKKLQRRTGLLRASGPDAWVVAGTIPGIIGIVVWSEYLGTLTGVVKDATNPDVAYFKKIRNLNCGHKIVEEAMVDLIYEIRSFTSLPRGVWIPRRLDKS